MAYEWPVAERNALYARLDAIEAKLNEIQVALNNLAPKMQLKQISVQLQAEVNAIKERLENLEG